MKKPLLLGCLAGALILFIFLAVLYHTTEAAHWQAREQAVRTAFAHTPMVHSDRVDVFNGEQSYMIVEGRDAKEQPMIVWIGGNGDDVHAAYVAQGVSREQLVANVKKADPDKRIIRVIPGVWQNTYAWEVYYKKKAAHAAAEYDYDYYAFSDGALLETYRLGD